MSCIGFSAYAIRNTKTNKVYVGSTTHCIKARFREHLNRARSGGGALIGAAIREFGERHFTIEKVASARDFHSLAELEIELIRQHEAENRGFGYNSASTGYPVAFNKPREMVCVCGVSPIADVLLERPDPFALMERLIDAVDFESGTLGLGDF